MFKNSHAPLILYLSVREDRTFLLRYTNSVHQLQSLWFRRDLSNRCIKEYSAGSADCRVIIMKNSPVRRPAKLHHVAQQSTELIKPPSPLFSQSARSKALLDKSYFKALAILCSPGASSPRSSSATPKALHRPLSTLPAHSRSSPRFSSPFLSIYAPARWICK